MNIDLQAREIQPLRQTFDRVQAYTGDKPASRYLEAILSTQPTENFHYRATWEPEYELFDQRRTAIRMADWNSLRDPGSSTTPPGPWRAPASRKPWMPTTSSWNRASCST